MGSWIRVLAWAAIIGGGIYWYFGPQKPVEMPKPPSTEITPLPVPNPEILEKTAKPKPSAPRVSKARPKSKSGRTVKRVVKREKTRERNADRYADKLGLILGPFAIGATPGDTRGK